MSRTERLLALIQLFRRCGRPATCRQLADAWVCPVPRAQIVRDSVDAAVPPA